MGGSGQAINALMRCIIMTPLCVGIVGFMVNNLVLGNSEIVSDDINGLSDYCLTFNLFNLMLYVLGHQTEFSKIQELFTLVFFGISSIITPIVFFMNAMQLPTTSDYLYGLMIVNYIFGSILVLLMIPVLLLLIVYIDEIIRIR
jgi:hypothetical protein